MKEPAPAFAFANWRRADEPLRCGGCLPRDRAVLCPSFYLRGAVLRAEVLVTKKDLLGRVTKELNLDLSDPFTLLFANACALLDHRDQLKRENTVLQEEFKRLEDHLMRWFKAASPYATPGSLEEGLKKLRSEVIEECADLADQKLDHYSGTECTYVCDVAEAIRALKNAAPQEQDARAVAAEQSAPDGTAPAVAAPAAADLARAAELLLRYAAVVRDCHSHELERFDYLPEIEEAAENVLAAARLYQAYAKDDAESHVSHTDEKP